MPDDKSGYTLKTRGPCLVFSCMGQLMAGQVAEAKPKLEEALAREDCETVVADLSRTTFLDSSAVGLLVALNTRVFSLGKQMHLLAPSPEARKILDTVKVLSFFNVLDDPDDLLLLDCE